MSDNPAPVVNENGSDDEKDDEQVTSVNQKKEDAKVEKELDRVTDRVDDEEIGSENMGNVNLAWRFSFVEHSLCFLGPIGD